MSKADVSAFDLEHTLNVTTLTWPITSRCSDPGGGSCSGGYPVEQECVLPCGCGRSLKTQTVYAYLLFAFGAICESRCTIEAFSRRFPHTLASLQDARRRYVEGVSPVRGLFEDDSHQRILADMAANATSDAFCDKHFKGMWKSRFSGFIDSFYSFEAFKAFVRLVLDELATKGCIERLDQRIDWHLECMTMINSTLERCMSPPVFLVSVVSCAGQPSFTTVTDTRKNWRLDVLPPHSQFCISMRCLYGVKPNSMVGAIVQINGKPDVSEFVTVPFSYFNASKRYVSPGFWTKPSEGKYTPYKATPCSEPVTITVWFYDLVVAHGTQQSRRYEPPTSSTLETVAHAPKISAENLRVANKSYLIPDRSVPIAKASVSYITADLAEEMRASPAFGNLCPHRWQKLCPTWVSVDEDGRPMVNEDGVPLKSAWTWNGSRQNGNDCAT